MRRIVRDEPFGAMLPVLSYRDTDEVVRRANNTRFGLGGSAWGPPEDAEAIRLPPTWRHARREAKLSRASSVAA